MLTYRNKAGNDKMKKKKNRAMDRGGIRYERTQRRSKSTFCKRKALACRAQRVCNRIRHWQQNINNKKK